MKCRNCGSNLAMEDEKCLFCGTENPFAQKHRKEMKHFTKEFHKTKEEVMDRSNRFNQWTVKITICAVLVAACLALVVIMQNSYNFQRLWIKSRVNANLDWYIEQLDTMEENREYLKMTVFWSDHNLYFCDNLNEYESVIRCCENFQYIYQYTMDIVTLEEDEYFSHERRAGYAADSLNYLYQSAKKQPYADETQYTPKHQAFMDDLVKDTEAFLQTYYGLSDDEVASLQQLSDAKRKVLLEEGVKQYE